MLLKPLYDPWDQRSWSYSCELSPHVDLIGADRETRGSEIERIWDKFDF